MADPTKISPLHEASTDELVEEVVKRQTALRVAAKLNGLNSPIVEPPFYLPKLARQNGNSPVNLSNATILTKSGSASKAPITIDFQTSHGLTSWSFNDEVDRDSVYWSLIIKDEI